MLPRAPNIQALILTVSYTFNVAAAAWIYADAKARRVEKPVFAAFAVLLLGPLWLAFYMTDRPLRADERRDGGFGWNWMRNLAITWTAATAPWLGVAAFAIARGDIDAFARRLIIATAAWLLPMLIMLLVGYFLRRPDTREEGGPAPARTRIPLAAVPTLAVILTFTILTAVFSRAA